MSSDVLPPIQSEDFRTRVLLDVHDMKKDLTSMSERMTQIATDNARVNQSVLALLNGGEFPSNGLIMKVDRLETTVAGIKRLMYVLGGMFLTTIGTIIGGFVLWKLTGKP